MMNVRHMLMRPAAGQLSAADVPPVHSDHLSHLSVSPNDKAGKKHSIFAIPLSFI